MVKFKYYNTGASFSPSSLANDDIAFVEDSKTIYTHGVAFKPLVPINTSYTGTSNFTASVGTYYEMSSAVNTLTVTLPSITDTTKVETIILHFTTGTTPNVTLTASGGKTISYFSDYAIEASTEYELNILWNGTKWIVAYATIG